MVRKNWTQIALVSNEQVRHALIAAKGDDAERLSKAYPECFLSEGAPVEPISHRALFALVAQARHRDDVIDMVKGLELPYERISYRGSCRGATDGVSYYDGGYPTVRHGYGSYFYRCAKKAGEVVEFRGSSWVVVHNGFHAGNAEMFASHTLLLVPVSAIAETNQASLDALVAEMNARLTVGKSA